jgi:HK97 family phage portal protein
VKIITRALSALGLERRSVPGGDPYWSGFAGLRSSTVNDQTAQGVSAVYACVQAISETTASLPLILFKREGEDRVRAQDHPLYRVLHDMANPEQTALEAREYLQACVLLRGNGFARIVRGFDGQVVELWPLRPDRVAVLRAGGKLAYDYTDGNGVLHRLLAHEVLHLRHRLGDDGVLGVSPIAAARGVVDLALAESQHGVDTFRNGAKLLGVLKFPGMLNPAQRDAIKQSWSSQYGGGGNAGRTAILEGGVDFQTVSMSLEDAEWIAARQFSVEEVARLFRVPPTVIGDLRHGNYSNSVEMARQFATMTLRRHLVAWEQAISKQMLTDEGRRIYFAEHQVEGLLRGDSTNRADFYDKGISAGWLLPSEARRLENLPVIEGIDDAKPANVA